ncbi:unnamed protein product, partial [Prorocentrum cordatum]
AKLDSLDDDGMDREFHFLVPDFGGGEDEDGQNVVDVDLDQLAPDRQRGLIQFVDKELERVAAAAVPGPAAPARTDGWSQLQPSLVRPGGGLKRRRREGAVAGAAERDIPVKNEFAQGPPRDEERVSGRVDALEKRVAEAGAEIKNLKKELAREKEKSRKRRPDPDRSDSPSKPKPPPSAFARYCQSIRGELKGLSAADQSVCAGGEWHDLPLAQKDAFKREHAEAQQSCSVALAAYSEQQKAK